MATVMSGYAESGLTTAKFFRRRRSDGAWWNTSGVPAFEAYNVVNFLDYLIAATETGTTGAYTATDPSPTTDGDCMLVKASAPPVVGDLTAGVRWQELINAPPPDDFTATMKSSITAAVPTAAANAAAVEAAILDEGDATALLAAIAAKVEAFLINEGDATATLAAIATAVWANAQRRLTDATNITSDGATISQTQLAHLDADISSRTKPADTQAAVTLVGTTTNLSNLPAAPTDWLDAAAVKADAVTKIQAGLSTYAGGDTAGTTTLLARVPAAVALAGSAPSWYAAPVDVSANVATIMAKTNNLPPDPADASDITTAFTSFASHGDSAWATPVGFSTLTTADIDARLAAAGLAFSLSNGATMSQWAEGVICLIGAGKLSGALAGAPCTPTVRDLADSKDLFTVTSDGIGNRTISLWTP